MSAKLPEDLRAALEQWPTLETWLTSMLRIGPLLRTAAEAEQRVLDANRRFDAAVENAVTIEKESQALDQQIAGLRARAAEQRDAERLSWERERVNRAEALEAAVRQLTETRQEIAQARAGLEAVRRETEAEERKLESIRSTIQDLAKR